MKKSVFILLFIAVCSTVQAQESGWLDGANIIGSKSQVWWKIGKFSVLNPPKQAPASGRDTGSLYYNIADESIYTWSGSVWKKAAGGIPSDTSLSINNRILNNLQRLLDSLSNHIGKIDGKQAAGNYLSSFTETDPASWHTVDTAGKKWDWGDITGAPSFITNIPGDSSVSINNRINGKLSANGDGSALTGLTKTQVGLANVDNTSDANKPVSTATQTALNGKQAILVSNTNIKTINGTSLLGAGDIGVSGTSTATFVNLASLFSSTSTTPATVTGWSFAVTSGKTYRIEVIADYQTAATTTGGILGISLTTATGTVRGYAMGTIVNTAAASDLIIPIRSTSGAGSSITTSGVTAINSPHSMYMLLTFTCTASGTFNIQWATEVSTSAAQLNANSSLIYQTLN